MYILHTCVHRRSPRFVRAAVIHRFSFVVFFLPSIPSRHRAVLSPSFPSCIRTPSSPLLAATFALGDPFHQPRTVCSLASSFPSFRAGPPKGLHRGLGAVVLGLAKASPFAKAGLLVVVVDVEGRPGRVSRDSKLWNGIMEREPAGRRERAKCIWGAATDATQHNTKGR